jgi:hypothetical protein
MQEVIENPLDISKESTMFAQPSAYSRHHRSASEMRPLCGTAPDAQTLMAPAATIIDTAAHTLPRPAYVSALAWSAELPDHTADSDRCGWRSSPCGRTGPGAAVVPAAPAAVLRRRRPRGRRGGGAGSDSAHSQCVRASASGHVGRHRAHCDHRVDTPRYTHERAASASTHPTDTDPTTC